MTACGKKGKSKHDDVTLPKPPVIEECRENCDKKKDEKSQDPDNKTNQPANNDPKNQAKEPEAPAALPIYGSWKYDIADSGISSIEIEMTLTVAEDEVGIEAVCRGTNQSTSVSSTVTAHVTASTFEISDDVTNTSPNRINGVGCSASLDKGVYSYRIQGNKLIIVFPGAEVSLTKI